MVGTSRPGHFIIGGKERGMLSAGASAKIIWRIKAVKIVDDLLLWDCGDEEA
jgi:hypothetical protein